MDLLMWLPIIFPTLLPSIIESKTGTVSYNPQRVMRQLGYDQSAIRITGEMGYSESMTVERNLLAKARYVLCPNSN